MKKLSQPGYIICGMILFAITIYIFYNVDNGTSKNVWMGVLAFLGIGAFGVAFEEPKDTTVRDTPKVQRFKTSIPKFTSLNKLKNGEMKLDEIKKRYKIIAKFYNNYKFNLYKDVSNYKIAQKQMNDIVNVVEANLNEIAEGTGTSFLDFPMLISGMVYFKFVTKKRVIEVNNDLKEMHNTGERLDFDDKIMGALESILGI